MHLCPKCGSEMEEAVICTKCGHKKDYKKESIVDKIFGSKFFWVWYFITGLSYCCLLILFLGTSGDLAIYLVILIPIALLFWWFLYYVLIMMFLGGFPTSDPFLAILAYIVFFSLPFIAFLITSRFVEKPRI